MQKTLTRADLAFAVYQELGLSMQASSEMVEAVLEEIIRCFERGETVKLSSFGTFSIRTKRQRIGRNPKTGVEVPITPRKVLTFNGSNILKARINDRASAPRGRKKASAG